MELYVSIVFLILGRWMAARELGCTTSEDLLGCSAHYFKGYNDCLPAKLAQTFPTLYSLDDNAPPERPKQLTLTPFERRYSNDNYYSGATVSIQPPTTAGVNYVKGFELGYSGTDLENGSDKGGPRCIILFFTIDKLNASFRYANFSVDVYPISSGVWSFTAYSLPRPPTEEDTTQMFRQSSLVVHRYGYNGSVASKYWYTTISYKVNFADNDMYGSIVFSFIASYVYDFLQYNVQLFKVNGEYPVDEMIIHKNNAPGEHAFQSVNEGNYQIKITPYDPHRLACRDEHGYLSTCTVTSTSTITIGDQTSTSTTTPNGNSVYGTTTAESSGMSTFFSTSMTSPTHSMLTYYREDSLEKIVAAVLGVALGLLLLALTAYCMCQRRRKHHSPEGNNGNATLATKLSANCFKIPKDEMQEKDNDKMGTDCGEQTILLSYHAVNSYHDFAVKKLGDYLQSKVRLNVTVLLCKTESPEQDLSFRKSLDKAHVIVLISSPENDEHLSYDIELYLKGRFNTSDDTVYKIKPKLFKVSFDYPAMENETNRSYSYPDTFTIMTDIHKLTDQLSLSGMQQGDANTLDRKSQKSKLNELEKAVNLALQFYKENRVVEPSGIQIGNMVDTVPDSYDSGYHEIPSIEESTQQQKLDSISNVLEKNRRLHPFDTAPQLSGHYVIKELYPSVIVEHPSMPYDFHEPSEVFSTNDISTLVMQQEICNFNERNLYQDRQPHFSQGSDLEETYMGRYDDECISVGSGKSV